MEEIRKELLKYLIKSPLWLICVALMFGQGNLILMLIYGFESKKINKIIKIKLIGKFIPIAIGSAFSGLVFLFQNFDAIIKSEMTFELMEGNMLSSIILSFAIIGAISMVVLPIRERKRLKGDNRNNEN